MERKLFLLLIIYLEAANRSKIVYNMQHCLITVSSSSTSSMDLVMKVLSEFYQNNAHPPDARISVLQLIEQVRCVLTLATLAAPLTSADKCSAPS